MEGNGDDVEMNATENDRRSVSVGNEDYAVGEVHAMTSGFSPPPIGNRPARVSYGLPLMPTMYDWPPPFLVSQGYNVPKAERVRREAEKKRIRDDIIAAGVAWRRSLEKEVLRDLQVEGFGFPGFEHFRVPETDEEKLIALAKLDENLVEVPSVHCPGVKKPKKELSCSLCNESSINDKDLNSHLEGRKHQAKVAAAKAELAAKCCGTPLARRKPANLAKLKVTPPANGVKRKAETLSEVPSLLSPCGSTPPMANKPANLRKLSFTDAGSELNGDDVKGTSPASSASDIAPVAEVEVGEEVGSKTKESASQDYKSLLSEKKYKNWHEMWEDCALAPDINVANQRSQSNEIVAGLPIRRLSANDEKEDATEQVHDVLKKGKVELAFPKGITAEAFANLAQLRFTSSGKKDDIAIEEADGSTDCDAKIEAVQEHEKEEGAALNAMAAEAARRENVRKLFKKTDQN